MSVSVSQVSQLTVTEILPNNTYSASSSKRTVTHDQFNPSRTLDATTTPNATEVAAFQAVLSSGALTLDLTALVTTNGKTLDASALKLRQILIVNPGSNDITIKTGASNGYAASSKPFHANGQIVPAGGDLLLFFNAGTPAVSGSVKTLDLAGTGTDFAYIEMVFGT